MVMKQLFCTNFTNILDNMLVRFVCIIVNAGNQNRRKLFNQ